MDIEILEGVLEFEPMVSNYHVDTANPSVMFRLVTRSRDGNELVGRITDAKLAGTTPQLRYRNPITTGVETVPIIAGYNTDTIHGDVVTLYVLAITS